MSEKDPTLVEATLLAWNKKYPAGTGHLDADMISFGEMLLAETKRRNDLRQARGACLEGGGHFFSFLTGMNTGEWLIEGAKSTISGWRGCDIKCDNCDAWLTIHYKEKVI